MPNSPRRILVLTLGGTIDAKAYPLDEKAYPVQAIPAGKNAAFKALQYLFPAIEFSQIHLCDKDSKEINAKDIADLCSHIQSAENYERIVITMGTDRMRETAFDIKSRITVPPCPVIFTGAIWPLANGAEKSDGLQNLSLAVKTAPIAGDQIYIAMSGHFEPPENLVKNFTEKRFDLCS